MSPWPVHMARFAPRPRQHTLFPGGDSCCPCGRKMTLGTLTQTHTHVPSGSSWCLPCQGDPVPQHLRAPATTPCPQHALGLGGVSTSLWLTVEATLSFPGAHWHSLCSVTLVQASLLTIHIRCSHPRLLVPARTDRSPVPPRPPPQRPSLYTVAAACFCGTDTSGSQASTLQYLLLP